MVSPGSHSSSSSNTSRRSPSPNRFRHFCLRAVRLLVAASMWLLPATGLAQDPIGQLEIDEGDRKSRVLFLIWPDDTTVDDTLFKKLRASIETAAESGPTALVLVIDSPGGLVSSTQKLTDLITSYAEHEDLRIYAYVPRQAISAAAWVAMACEGLFIRPDASIGNVQPLIEGFRGYERADEKVVTMLAESMVLTTRRNGIRPTYPRIFVEAMVDREMEIVRIDNPRLGTSTYRLADDFARLTERDRQGLETHVVTNGGRALVTNGSDMVDYGFRVRLVRDMDEIMDFVATQDAEREDRKLVVRKGLGIGIDWTWVLLMAAFFFLVLEMKSPGIGAFGVLSLLAFVGFFFVNAGVTETTVVASILLLLGMFLLIVEVLVIPGFGLAGIAGLGLVLYATYVAVAAPDSGNELFPLPDFGSEAGRHLVTQWGLLLIFSLVGGITLSFALGNAMRRLPYLNRMLLVGPREKLAGERHTTETRADAAGLGASVSVGDRGVAVSDLRPVGAARIDGRRVDVITRGRMVRDGAAIVVVKVEGNRIVVKEDESATA